MSKAKDRQMADTLRALGHPVRVQIVRQLLERGASYAGDLTRRLPVAASTASQHLKILKQAELISDTVDGPHRVYAVNRQAILEFKGWVKSL